MTDINWNILPKPETVWDSFERGYALVKDAREREEQSQFRNALGSLAANPDDEQARGFVFSRNPQLGMQIQDYADKRAFNGAMAEYLAAPQTNALTGIAVPPPQGAPAQVPNALLTGGAAPSQMAPAVAPKPPVQPHSQPDPQASGPDLSFLGEPQTGRDRAFLAMLQRDPVKALKIQSDLRENFVSQLEAERDAYALGIDRLSRAQDDPQWQSALQEIVPRFQAIGADLFSVVPTTYPGDEGVKALMERALPVKDRLDFLLREANVEADNVRADRNTDSLIDTREGRLAEYQRANRAREGNQRRGQDMVDRRARAGGSKSSGTKPARPVKVASPQEAERLTPGTRYQTPDGEVYVR